LFERILINNQIRAEKVRLIDAEGKQLGIFDLGTALQKAREQGLDLVQVTHRIFPPVCKIIDAGKYFYQQAKKQKIKAIYQSVKDLTPEQKEQLIMRLNIKNPEGHFLL